MVWCYLLSGYYFIAYVILIILKRDKYTIKSYSLPSGNTHLSFKFFTAGNRMSDFLTR